MWLSADYDSPYALYQFFMRLADIDVGPMLRQLTFLPLSQIKEIESEHMKAPEKFVSKFLVFLFFFSDVNLLTFLGARPTKFWPQKSFASFTVNEEFKSLVRLPKFYLAVPSMPVCARAILRRFLKGLVVLWSFQRIKLLDTLCFKSVLRQNWLPPTKYSSEHSSKADST